MDAAREDIRGRFPRGRVGVGPRCGVCSLESVHVGHCVKVGEVEARHVRVEWKVVEWRSRPIPIPFLSLHAVASELAVYGGTDHGMNSGLQLRNQPVLFNSLVSTCSSLGVQ